MLPRNYKFALYNETGQTIAIGGGKVYVRRWKFDSSGALVYEASVVTLSTAGTVATATQGDIGAAQDNSANLYLGADDCVFEVTAPASSSGNVSLYLLVSTDGGTTWQDQRGAPLAVLNFTAAATKRIDFSL